MTQPSEGEIALFPSERAANAPVLFFTNRYNLLEFLSSGLITPVAGVTKYYPDLLELCPGRVPLVRGPLGASLLRLVSDDDPSSFPVALEINVSGVTRNVPALTSDGPAELGLGDSEAESWAVGGVIPITSVVRVHFRSERDLNEHLAREYENVPFDIVPMVASPHLFEEGVGDATTAASWLRALPEIRASEAYQLADRVAGARALALIAAPADPGFVRGVAALFGAKAKPTPKRSAEDVFPRWLTLVALRDPEGSPSKGADLNEKLFRACVAVLARTHRTASWRPLEIVGSIEQRVRGGKLNKKEEAELDRNVEPIRAILRNDRDFRPFKQNSGLDVAKALLMVLLRPEPARLRAWSSADSGASETVELTAAVLAGYLTGYKRLPTSLRDSRSDRVLAELQAEELNSNVEDAAFAAAALAVRISVEEAKSATGRDGISILWAGEPILTREAPRDTPAQWLARADLTDPKIKSLSLNVCGELGWNDCVRTEIVIGTGSFATSGTSAGTIKITLSGIPAVTYDLLIDPFVTRLLSEGLSGQPAALVEAAREMVPPAPVALP
jgi:hypothetical protein